MSKMKQNLKQQINITRKTHEETGWKRYLCFEYEGKEYELFLFWNEFDGYDINWRSPDKTPDWIIAWNEEAHNGNTFEAYLDELTYEMEWK